MFKFLAYDSAGRVRWHSFEQASEEVCRVANGGVGHVILVVPEPPVPAPLVREFIKAQEGYDPGEFESGEDAMAYSTVND